jgi:DNA repair exonuclease SbcCD ATPase subunit
MQAYSYFRGLWQGLTGTTQEKLDYLEKLMVRERNRANQAEEERDELRRNQESNSRNKSQQYIEIEKAYIMLEQSHRNLENSLSHLTMEQQSISQKLNNERGCTNQLRHELQEANGKLKEASNKLAKWQSEISKSRKEKEQLEQEKKKIESELIQLRCSMNSVSQLERGGKPLTSTTVKDDFIDLRDQVLLELSNEVGDLGDLSGDKMDELLEKMYEEAFFKFWENVAEMKSDDRIVLRQIVQSMDKDMEHGLEKKMHRVLLRLCSDYTDDLSNVSSQVDEAAKLVVKFNLDMVIPEPAIIIFNAATNEKYNTERHKNKNIKVQGTHVAQAISPGMMTSLGKIMDPAAVLLK